MINFINFSVTPNDILKISRIFKSKNKIQNVYLDYNDENKLMLYFSVKNASEPIIKAQFQDAIAKIKTSYKTFFTNLQNSQNYQINLTSKDC